MTTQDKLTQALFVLERATSFTSKKARDGHAKAVTGLREALAEHEAQAQAGPALVHIRRALVMALRRAPSERASEIEQAINDLDAMLAAAPQPEAIPSVNFRGVRRRDAAEATLKHLGYEWCGGELWKPPLGKAPGSALAAQQAERDGLTLEELHSLADRCTPKNETGALNYLKFARAIERAHGIGKDQS